MIEAESGARSGGATVTTTTAAWTGESQWSGGQYVSATAGSTVTWNLVGSSQPRLVQPVPIDLRNLVGANPVTVTAQTTGGTAATTEQRTV